MAKYFVVDGDTGADVYGEARSANDALLIARKHFVDFVSHVELYGPISMRDGSTLQRAWVAFTAV